ncbi:MAG: right-handed parallel beta-helix repeat-containing protein [Oscillospiraceae bacterium]|nr:right-handed parallel beta-helix repeat-containing protein [Oscillospiraceae bacterium]
MAIIYYVAKTGNDAGTGSKEEPFLTIGAAAKAARAGDTIIVHKGEYREWVKPVCGGLSNRRRIIYETAKGEKVIIKGSERIQNWEKADGFIWKAVLTNTMFDGYNPYLETVAGDWLMCPVEHPVHLGDVYLNGMSFYEAESYDALKNPIVRTEILDNGTKETVPIKNPEQTKYLWFAVVDAENTTIYANFHGADPNREMVEVNVRRSCFYPDRTGVSYITVRGFEMAHAATPWAPPTADQPGLIGPNWSKGWIIENNIIHDSKCSAISIGKEASTGNNYRTLRRDKPGYQYQLESVFAARKIGWSKETIGSHIIRGNTIYDCGQNGIVGHLGCVFSEIYDNHIYNIALKREFFGHEIAGIKLHAAIDVQIHHNHIHDCSLGTWLDWQAQGTRVSKNLYYNNNRDLFVEVSHGPYIVDHNILGSKFSLDNHAQGGAYVNNLFAGKIILKKELNRATPYHAPHSTDVTGYAMVYGADDRFYNNIFIGGATTDTVGTAIYDGCTTSLEEYIEAVDAKKPGDLEIFEPVEQTVYISGNVYFDGAKSFAKEADKLDLPEFHTDYAVEQNGGEVHLVLTLPEVFGSYSVAAHGTESLGRVRVVDAEFENPDGSSLTLDSDYFGSISEGAMLSGPFAVLKIGENRVKVWG